MKFVGVCVFVRWKKYKSKLAGVKPTFFMWMCRMMMIH